jgi:hypothetical protein
MYNIIENSMYFLFGVVTHLIIQKVKKRLNDLKKIKDINKQYIELINNIEIGKSKFVNRTDQTVFLETNLEDWNDVSIIYFLDKEIICIFKEDNCLYTSQILENKIKFKLISKINEKHKNEINDIIDVLGMPVSKNNFISKLEEIKNKQKEESEINKIVTNNDNKLDIDEILDKINIYGFEKLTIEEKEFLKNFKI